MARLVESIEEDGSNRNPHVVGKFFIFYSSLLICSKLVWPWLHFLAFKLSQHMLHVLCTININSRRANDLHLWLELDVRWEHLASSSTSRYQHWCQQSPQHCNTNHWESRIVYNRIWVATAIGVAAIKRQACLIELTNPLQLLLRDVKLPRDLVASSRPQLDNVMLPVVKLHQYIFVQGPTNLPVFLFLAFCLPKLVAVSFCMHLNNDCQSPLLLFTPKITLWTRGLTCLGQHTRSAPLSSLIVTKNCIPCKGYNSNN